MVILTSSIVSSYRRAALVQRLPTELTSQKTFLPVLIVLLEVIVCTTLTTYR